MGKVLQHLKDDQIEDSVGRQYELLNPGGIICHSFWKGEGSEVFKGMFVNYHSPESLTGLFGEKFELLLMEEYPEFEEGDSKHAYKYVSTMVNGFHDPKRRGILSENDRMKSWIKPQNRW